MNALSFTVSYFQVFMESDSVKDLQHAAQVFQVTEVSLNLNITHCFQQ